MIWTTSSDFESLEYKFGVKIEVLDQFVEIDKPSSNIYECPAQLIDESQLGIMHNPSKAFAHLM